MTRRTGRYDMRKRIEKSEAAAKQKRGHPFTVFRLGLDMCAKCQKPRKEHK